MEYRQKKSVEVKQNTNLLKFISLYRQELMGLAILSVMYWHFVWAARQYTKASAEVMRSISFYGTIFGSLGVEIFVFLSGLGLYFSMARSPKVLPFYRKRFERIIIPYVFIVPMLLALLSYLSKYSLTRYFSELTLISFCTRRSTILWYVAFCIVVYIFFPVIFKILQNKNGEKYCAALAVLLMVLFICTAKIFPKFYHNVEIALGRIPLFVIGSIYGKKIYNNQNMNKFDWCFILSGLIVKLIYILSFYFKSYHSYMPAKKIFDSMRPFMRFIMGWSALSYILILACLFYLVRKTFLSKLFAWFGSMSLELYMSHMLVKQIFYKLGIAVWRVRYYALAMLISIFISYIVHKATITVFSEIEERRKKKLKADTSN